MKAYLYFVVCFFGLILNSASAADRIAFVVGNSSYTNITQLENPRSDAALVSKALEGAGFHVETFYDLKKGQLLPELDTFVRKYEAYRKGNKIVFDAILFYFAGHGVQFDGKNYLLPTDIGDEQMEVAKSSDDMNAILRKVSKFGAENYLFIFDACRNQPFENQASTGNGLSEVDAPLGTYIAFSAKPGGVAVDGEGQYSPFAENFAYYINHRNLTIEATFKKVRSAVVDQTDYKQIPWSASSLTREFKFKPTSGFGKLEVEESIFGKR